MAYRSLIIRSILCINACSGRLYAPPVGPMSSVNSCASPVRVAISICLKLPIRCLQKGPATKQLLAWWHKVEKLAGFRLSLLWHLDIFLEQAGIVDITAQPLHVPLGSWGGRIGALLAKDMLCTFRALKGFYCAHLSLDEEVFEQTVAALPQEWERYLTQYCFFLAYGRKPEREGERHGGQS